MPMAASLHLFSEMCQILTQMSGRSSELLGLGTQSEYPIYAIYLFAFCLCYLSLKTTLRTRKYCLHFTEEETKGQRAVIEDSLRNGYGGIQVPFFYQNGLFPQKYLSKIFQKKKFTFKNLNILRVRELFFSLSLRRR